MALSLFVFGLMSMLAGCSLIDGRNIEGQVIFEDRFLSGQTGRWQTETDGLGQSLIVDEVMMIALDQPETIQYVLLAEPAFSDFAAEVDVTQTAGSTNSSFGLLFRMQNPDSFYRFSITGNGLYIVEKHTAEVGWQRLTDDWPAAPALRQGLNQTNRLRIEAIGSQLAFFANDEPLVELVDNTFAGGNIALAAGTFNQGGLSVAFDNVVVTYP